MPDPLSGTGVESGVGALLEQRVLEWNHPAATGSLQVAAAGSGPAQSARPEKLWKGFVKLAVSESLPNADGSADLSTAMTLSAESHENGIAELAQSCRIQRLLALWEGLARDDVPSFTEMMEAGLGDLAEHYAILVPDGAGDFLYVHYGRAIKAASGTERCGQTVAELPSGISGYLAGKLARSMETGRPVYIVSVAQARPGVDTWERLVVPLRTSGESRLLIMLVEPHDLRETVSSAVLEASPDAVIAFRAVEDDLGTVYDARIVAVNESACRVIRRSREQLLHSLMLQTFPQTRANGIWDQCRDVIQTRRTLRFDINNGLTSGDGQFRISLFHLYGGFAMMLQDITDLSGDAIPMIRRHVTNVQRMAPAGF